MAEPSVGELVRWLEGMERRMGEMHGENRAGLAELKADVREVAELQREANGRTAKLETRAAVLEAQIATSQDEIVATKKLAQTASEQATQVATAAAAQAIRDTAPTQKRTAAITAAFAGATGGGILGIYKVIEIIATQMK